MTDTAINTAATAECPGMAEEVLALNRRYLRCVRNRTLCDAVRVNAWRARVVDVFLRHESDHVFAIAAAGQIGMANFVAIEDARFCVDEAGRVQACRSEGSLPNGRNVHAFVKGRLLWAAMNGPTTDPELWRPVVYNPKQMRAFELSGSGHSLSGAAFVIFTPGLSKVWCLHPSLGTSTEAPQ